MKPASLPPAIVGFDGDAAWRALSVRGWEPHGAQCFTSTFGWALSPGAAPHHPKSCQARFNICLLAHHSPISPLFPCSHLNAVELGAASFWLRVALGAAVTALVGFTLYRVLAKNK